MSTHSQFVSDAWTAAACCAPEPMWRVEARGRARHLARFTTARAVFLWAAAALVGLAPSVATACGGFFCDGSSAVRQSGERILFEIHDDDTVTTTVEIQYQGQPENFSWILPVPPEVELSDLSTVEPGLFDALEVATHPIFRWLTDEEGRPRFNSSTSSYQSGDPVAFGCMSRSASSSGGSNGVSESAAADDASSGGDDGGSAAESVEEVSTVQLVGEASVGPYDIQLIATDEGADLVTWLSDNGYQQPPGAGAAMAPYVSAGMSFLALRLDPEVGSGAIEALSFTYSGDTPAIPLVLTSVAATPAMEIIAFVVADQRYEPQAPYLHLPFDWDEVEPTAWGTNYSALLSDAVVRENGHAFVTEFAGATSSVPVDAGSLAAEILDAGVYLSRFRTYISPWEMTVDPTWGPSDSSENVSNIHTIGADGVSMTSAGLGPLVLMLVAARRSRRRTS